MIGVNCRMVRSEFAELLGQSTIRMVATNDVISEARRKFLDQASNNSYIPFVSYAKVEAFVSGDGYARFQPAPVDGRFSRL